MGQLRRYTMEPLSRSAMGLRHGAATDRGRLVADRVWDRGSSGQSGKLVGFRLPPGRGLTHWRSIG